MTLLPSTGGKGKQDPSTFRMHRCLGISCILNKRTALEAALWLSDVCQAGVRSALQLLKPGQVLLLGLGALLRLQGPF